MTLRGGPTPAAACAERQTCGHRGREDGSRRGWPTRTAGPFHRTLGAVIPPVCSRVRGTGVTRHRWKQKTRPGAGRPRGGTGATSQALPAARLAVPFRAGVWAARGPVRLLDGAARSSRARSETLRCSCAAGSRRPARLSGPGIPQAVAATPPAACPQAVAASLSPAACPQASPACPRAAAATPCRLPRGPAAQQGACPGDSQSPCSAVGNRTVSQDGKQAWGLGEGWRRN